jgi:hypothetical protein
MRVDSAGTGLLSSSKGDSPESFSFSKGEGPESFSCSSGEGEGCEELGRGPVEGVAVMGGDTEGRGVAVVGGDAEGRGVAVVGGDAEGRASGGIGGLSSGVSFSPFLIRFMCSSTSSCMIDTNLQVPSAMALVTFSRLSIPPFRCSLDNESKFRIPGSNHT